MDPKHLEHELKNYKLREAVLEKKSKFLKEWRERWVVITQNYLFTFKSSTQLTQPTDILDIRLIDSIKSYVKKGDDRQMGSFKVASQDSAFYFRCKTVTEKWSWIVFFERLLEHKNNGSTPHNDYDSIKKGGFISTEQYQTKGWPMLKQQSPGPQIDEAQQQLRRKMEAERLQQQRKAEEARMQEQLRLAQQLRLKQQQENKRRQEQAQANKQVQKVVQNSPTKNNNSAIDSNFRNVSDIKNIFQKKIEQNAVTKLKEQQSNLISNKWSKKQKSGEDGQAELISRRNNIVSGLFNQLKLKNTNSFRHIVEFLVNIGSDKQTGFVSYIIHQSKHNPSKFTFAQVFVQHYTENPTQAEIISMLGFLYIIYFESSSLFSNDQIRQIKKTLLKFLGSGKSEKIRSQALKTIITIHKASPFDSQDIKQNSNSIKELQTTSKSNETIGTAKKAKQLFGLVY